MTSPDELTHLRTEIARLRGERDEARYVAEVLTGQCRDLSAILAAAHARIAELTVLKADETEVSK